VDLISKAVTQNQPRWISRALRYNTPIRTRVTPKVLLEAVKKLVPEKNVLKSSLLDALAMLAVESIEKESTEMDVDGAPSKDPLTLPTSITAEA